VLWQCFGGASFGGTLAEANPAGRGLLLVLASFSRPAYRPAMGTLYYGDNLDILRRYLGDETVDLVYLDPPFNSAQTYNAFFHEKDGSAAASQIKAFEDTWQWNQDKRDAMSPDFLAEESRNYQDELSKIIGVVCLTEKPLDRLMWAHYAEPPGSAARQLAAHATPPPHRKGAGASAGRRHAQHSLRP
jgi:hypothetical protein